MHVWSLPFRLAWVPGAGSGSCRPRPGARVELSPYRHPFVCGDGSQKQKFYKIIYEFGKKIHGISMHISCMARRWWAAGQGRTTRARGHGMGRGGSTLPPPAQPRVPRIEAGGPVRPSDPAAGAVPVTRQLRRERARPPRPQTRGRATGQPTARPPGRAEERRRPSDAALLGWLRCHGTRA